MDEAEVTSDRLLGGAVTLLQPRRGHRAGTDAVLLAGLAGAQPGDRVVDLGSASGAVGLMIAHLVPDARITFVDRDPRLVALCRRNAELNRIADRVAAIEADVLEGAAGWQGIGATLVVTNPPFFEEGSPASPDLGRRAAHIMVKGGLAAWFDTAARCLRHRGRLALVHRADTLDVCLAALQPRFGSLELFPIRPRADTAASRIVIRGIKEGRAPLRLWPGLTLHGEDGRFTAEAAALHVGDPPQTKRAPEGALDTLP